MAFIQTIPPEEAEGLLAELYAADLKKHGFVPSYSQAWSLRPEALAAWRTLLSAIRFHMDPRRFELVTLIAAARLRCTYWTLYHGAALRSEFYTAAQIEAIVRDYRSAGLLPVDVAILAFAEKITLRAHEVTRQDVEDLRRQGLSDSEVLDIAMTAGARSFFSKVLDAVGAEPEERYKNLEKELRETLAVGRTFGKARDDDGPG